MECASDQRILTNSEINEDNSLEKPEIVEPQNLKKCWASLKTITLEPAIFLFFISIAMEGPLFAEIMLEKTCTVNFNYSTSICSNMSQHKEEQILVQQKANYFIMVYNIIKYFPTVLFVLFLGPWSDKHGRKIPLVLPFIGCALSSILMWINTTFWDLPLEYILLSAVPISFTGGLTCFTMGMYSYISDVSELEWRTRRIALIDTFVILGNACGLLLSNLTQSYIGFNGSYIAISCFYISAALYIIMHIKETRGKNAQRGLGAELMPQSRGLMRDLFDCANVRQTFRTTFEKRPNFGRAKLLLLMLSICLMVFVFSAMEKEYYYTKLKFDWHYQDYIYWVVATIFISLIGIAFIFPLLSLKLNIQDEWLGLVGSASVIADFLMMAFAQCSYQMYIASGVGILSGVPLAVSRSMLSKMVPEAVTGKVFSALACWESLVPFVAASLYTVTYNASVEAFPGTFLALSSVAYALSGLVFVVIYFLSRREIVGFVVETGQP